MTRLLAGAAVSSALLLSVVALPSTPASAVVRPARVQTWGTGPVSCHLSGSLTFLSALTDGNAPAAIVSARLSRCVSNVGGQGIAGGTLTGSYATSPVTCPTLANAIAPLSGEIKWRGTYRPSMLNNGDATGGFQGAVTTTYGAPARLAARCAGGIVVLHVGGSVTVGPNCGPGQPPVAILPIGSRTICGFKYLPTSIAAGSDGALWFTTKVRDARGGSYIGRMTTSGVVSMFDAGTFVSDDIVAGPDGALWFIGSATIGRMTTSGQVTTYGPFSDGAGNILFPTALTTGPDGALWFTSLGHWVNVGTTSTQTPGYLGRITTSGAFSFFPLPSGEPWALASGSDGALWFVTAGTWVNNSYVSGYVGRMSTSGVVTAYNVLSGAAPSITAGPDGALWFIDGNAIGRMATDGTVTTYPLSGPDPVSITAGPDGALWFADYSYSPSPDFAQQSGSIGRITTSGQVSVYVSPGIYAPFDITSGPDGALWFVNYINDTIGRIATP